MLDTENGTHAEIFRPALAGDDKKKERKTAGNRFTSAFAVAVTIDRTPEDLYAFWRNFENLPRFMENIHEVSPREGDLTHWVVKSPSGAAEWDSQILDDIPNRRISWCSVERADVDNAGFVEFKPGPSGRGTEVRALVSFNAPGGAAGRIIAAMMQKDPHIQAKRDLRRFKQLMETGEIAISPRNQKPPAS